MNADIFSLNHDLYANSPAVIGDLRALEGRPAPPEARTVDFEKLTVEGGVYWRYEVPVAKP